MRHLRISVFMLFPGCIQFSQARGEPQSSNQEADQGSSPPEGIQQCCFGNRHSEDFRAVALQDWILKKEPPGETKKEAEKNQNLTAGTDQGP